MQRPEKKIFTPDELAFMQDGGLFEKKEELTRRIQELLKDFQSAIKSRMNPEELCAPEGTDFERGQLVRGERFHDRPYVYLDLPKFFSRQAMFTFRSFFWWGADFVFAWILSGPHLGLYKKNLFNHLDRIAGRGYHLSIASTPWEWRKNSTENVELRTQDPRDLEQLLAGMEFLKIQYFIGLDHPFWMEGSIVEAGVGVFDTLKVIVSR